jgi:hypothetical protein
MSGMYAPGVRQAEAYQLLSAALFTSQPTNRQESPPRQRPIRSCRSKRLLPRDRYQPTKPLTYFPKTTDILSLEPRLFQPHYRWGLRFELNSLFLFQGIAPPLYFGLKAGYFYL